MNRKTGHSVCHALGANPRTITRRQLLKAGAAAGAGFWFLSWNEGKRAFAQAAAPLNPKTLAKYVDALPAPVKIPVPGITAFELGMWAFPQQLHQQLPATMVWGYGTGAAASFPGPTIEAVKGVAYDIRWTNNLPEPHPLIIDQTLHWANPLNTPPPPPMTPYDGPIPAVVHVHGAEVEPPSDGHPDAWFTPGFSRKGPGWVKETLHYANSQPATTLWYHDHTLGMTRLNVYMGLAGFYLLTDAVEAGLNLPSGNYEREIVIQDRLFDVAGQLVFPFIGINPTVHPFWLPEFFGDTIVVNGKVWPYMNVEPRKYRLRLLNGSNARFYSLALIDPVTGTWGPPLVQIGTDGGFLAAPVPIPPPARLVIAPGERADVIVDFSAFPPGTNFILDNDAKTPFPKGAPPDPNTTGQIMQFRVVPLTGPDTSTLPPTITTIPALAADAPTRHLTLVEVMGPGGPLEVLLNNTKWSGHRPYQGASDLGVTEKPALGSTEIWEIINLTADAHPIHLHLVQFQLLSRQRLQTNKYLKVYDAAFPGGTHHDGTVFPPGVFMPAYGPPKTLINDPANPNYNPAFPGGNPDVTRYLQGRLFGPDPNEAGWKDTVQVFPGEVTRFIVTFAPIDGSPAYPFDATAEPGYVWHCHILDHEDNEMMRPYKVVP